MRSAADHSIAYQSVGLSKHKWLQAGFSFAYRLAHLDLPRLPLVAGISMLFYLA